MKGKDRAAIGLVIALGLIMIALGAVNSCATGQKLEGGLELVVNGEKIAVFTAQELSDMPSATFKATVRSSSEGTSETEFTGVEVREIILRAYPKAADGFKAVIVKAEDGYQTVMLYDEAMSAKNGYICYLMNGVPIKSKTQKGHGPLRLVIRDDQFGQRWVKYVTRIEIKV